MCTHILIIIIRLIITYVYLHVYPTFFLSHKRMKMNKNNEIIISSCTRVYVLILSLSRVHECAYVVFLVTLLYCFFCAEKLLIFCY